MAAVQSASRLQISQSRVIAPKFVCKAQEGETSAVKRQNERETGEKGRIERLRPDAKTAEIIQKV